MAVDLKAEEITEIIRQQLTGIGRGVDVAEVGTVTSVGDGIARVYGLEKVMAGELVRVPARRHRPGPQPRGRQRRRRAPRRLPGAQGRRPVQAHRTHHVRARSARPWSAAWSTRSAARSTARARSTPTEFYPIERLAPGVIDRKPVKEPLQTGLKAIDAMIPIGRGQRELIIGDRQTGKTAVAIDTIINQKGKDVICVYVAIGQKKSTVAQVVKTLEQYGAMDYTIVVNASASEAGAAAVPRAVRRLRDGRVLPLQRQARAGASTTISPSTPRRTARSRCCCAARRAARRIPATSSISTPACSSARRSCPTRSGGGSLTALPIIETQAGDVSAYIPTNVISITDGQIFLETDLFHSGVRPGHQRRHLGVARRRLGAGALDALGVGHAASRPRAVPRARGVRAVRLRPRQGHAGAAQPRQAPGRDPQAGAVLSRCASASRPRRSTPARRASSTTSPSKRSVRSRPRCTSTSSTSTRSSSTSSRPRRSSTPSSKARSARRSPTSKSST